MNRQEFFRRLEYLLRGIPESERADALAYYNDYFDDAGVENEQQVISELGSPEAVAQMILEDYHRGQQGRYGDYGSPEMEYEGTDNVHSKKKAASLNDKIKNMSTSTKVLAIILLVITFPLWIGIVAGVFGGAVGILGGLFGVVVGLGAAAIGVLISGIICLVAGVIRLLVSPVDGVVMVGIGALFTAISILLVLLLTLLAFKWLPTFVKAIIKWAKGLFKHQEGGMEI